MESIEKINYSGTINDNKHKLPAAVNIVCPFCKRNVHFAITWKVALNAVSNYAVISCPSCGGKVRFVYFGSMKEPFDLEKGELYSFPDTSARMPLKGVSQNDNLSDPLKRAYFSAINVYNTGEWSATATLCRKVLEGITHTLVPNGKANESLATRLQSLPGNVDFNKPVMTIADAIRKGGNLGAHFDLEREPDQEVTTLMIDLLDYLIEYLFVLPYRIELLHDKIEHLKKNGSNN